MSLTPLGSRKVKATISKTLLTPCRRIGLSRIKKTPNSLTKSTITEKSDNEHKTTPVSSIKTEKKAKDKPPITIILPNDENKEESELKKSEIRNKRPLEKSPKHTELESSPPRFKRKLFKKINPNLDAVEGKEINEDTATNTVKLGRFKTEEFLNEIQSNNNATGNSKENIKPENFDKLRQSPLNVSENPSRSVSEVTNHSHGGQHQSKKIKRSLSLKKPSKTSEDKIEDKTLTPLHVKIQRLSDDEIKKIQVDYHKNDSDSITKNNDTDEDESTKKFELIKKMRNLEREVHLKRDKLAKLKQAAVYKSKHSPTQLKPLIEIWNKGCAESLKDLLKNLQTHGPMDMNTLLNNIKIPSEIISELPLSDST